MRPLVARIASAALTHNLAVARRLAGQARVIAVVKANAYGHGLVQAARALAATDAYAVLTLDDAQALRQAGVTQPVLMLEGPFDAGEWADCAALRLTPVIHCARQLDWLAGVPYPGDMFLKFDSGMHRLGFALADFDAVLARARGLVKGHLTLMTHFATADDDTGCDWQSAPFLAAARPTGLPLSLANSAALLRHPNTHADWVRPGIMLYGASPFADAGATSLGLRPAMTLESGVIAVQTLKPGEGLGYGLLFRAEQPVRVGIVACGYADGYPRHAGTGTPVLVAGQRSRILGRVSMDMLAVDLTPFPGLGEGCPVTLWGEDLSVDEVAQYAGTIGYELLCALAPRVPVCHD
jgi:alanine racemase